MFDAFGDLIACDTLELVGAAPDPDTAVGLSRAERIRTALRAEHLAQPGVLAAVYAVTVRSVVAVLFVLSTEVGVLRGEVEAYFGWHPDVEVYRSQPGLGQVLGARVLGGFGGDSGRYRDAEARRNYAGASPIVRVFGCSRVVLARYTGNGRLADALQRRAFSALSVSPGACAYYDTVCCWGAGHRAALRRLGN